MSTTASGAMGPAHVREAGRPAGARGLAGRRGRRQFYVPRENAEKPYSFLYCDLAAKRPDEMFWLNFEQRLVPDSDGGESDG